jgi:3-hydroxy-9,10-secoandrosta-1,3,5(10)-triene-9,17-dione monooxygenase reductase component
MSHPVSSAGYREALAHFASGVTVVTANGDAGPVGFTATGFMSVSLSPPLVLVSVGKEASAYAGILGAPHFGVSVLGEAQGDVAMQFATKGIDRFAGIELEPEALAPVPLLRGSVARIYCARHARHEAGDHTLLVGEVLGVWVSPGPPLVHFNRRFGGFTGSE